MVGTRVSSLSIIFVVLPRSFAATFTLASLFSITLSWHLVVMTCGMLVKQAQNMSAIMPFKWANNCSLAIGSMLLWYLSKIVCVIRYIELATTNVLGGLSTRSPLVLISVTISLPLSENHLTTSIAVFSLKTLFAKGVSNHLHLFSTSCHKIRVVFRIFTYSFAVLRLSSTRWVNARPSPTLVNKLSTPSLRRATATHVKVTIGKLQLFTGSTGSKG
ncbi:hypothetical protein HanIR_Chr17g0856371 [Helianthus annuus]|nr:hypothetical protein HanIR_Chr17g0856371 [Helianthus annuus]